MSPRRTALTVEGISEPLSPSVRPDVRPEGTGACTCPAGTNFAACRCRWGVLVLRALQLGYGPRSTPAVLARELEDFAGLARLAATDGKADAVRRLGRGWVGSVAALARMVKLSPARVRQIVPTIDEMVRAAKLRASER